jgi:membrane-associated HD superfamily phosphohydrolase
MILDGIEASSRALDEKNEKKFRELIDEIIEEKVKDGQFSETDLTYAELERIKEELLIILLNQYHLRIKYHEDKGY